MSSPSPKRCCPESYDKLIDAVAEVQGALEDKLDRVKGAIHDLEFHVDFEELETALAKVADKLDLIEAALSMGHVRMDLGEMLDYCCINSAAVNMELLARKWDMASEALNEESGKMPLSLALQWLRLPGVQKMLGGEVV